MRLDKGGLVDTIASALVPLFERAVFAHRGLSSRAPENTLEAFALAVDRGATWLETDVDILADGTPVIIHDSTLDRTTNRAGSFYPLTAADLEDIDAGSWYGKEFAGARLPRLSDFIDFLNERKVNANIEIKQNEQGAERTILLIDAVAKELERLDPERQIIISSFGQPLLMAFHQRHPQYAIGVLYETAALYDDWLAVLELCGATYIHPEDSGLTASKVKQFREAGFGVNVWTVDDVDRANQLFNWGCTGVFTNCSDQMMHLV
ncbi:glycerophosphoryl diester phosphodiesterase [Actinobaculum sp. 352]|nr:glycerophosphoryl diester phosphodiesterase [Actinobaculum sp. 352]